MQVFKYNHLSSEFFSDLLVGRETRVDRLILADVNVEKRLSRLR